MAANTNSEWTTGDFAAATGIVCFVGLVLGLIVITIGQNNARIERIETQVSVDVTRMRELIGKNPDVAEMIRLSCDRDVRNVVFNLW